jgi:hypothetical protein
MLSTTSPRTSSSSGRPSAPTRRPAPASHATNGRLLSGTMPYEDLRRAVTEELSGDAKKP